MRSIRFMSALLTLGVVLALSSRADAQILDDTWFKLKVTAKGHAVANADGSSTKYNAKLTAYMHLTAAPPVDGGPPSTTYNVSLWTETAPGVWEETYTDDLSAFGNDTTLFCSDEYLEFDMQPAPAHFGGYQAARFSNKLDGKGGLKKSKFQTLGAELIDGTTDDTDVLVGTYKVNGTLIDPSKLPFEPILEK